MTIRCWWKFHHGAAIISTGNPAQLPGSVLVVFCRLWKE